jgi:enoyl-CoA hydratase/carnithine racemase
MSDLLIEDRGGVRILTMNRPDKRNALNHALTQALLAALHDTESDEGVRSIVLTGSGSAFCAGADLTEFKDTRPRRLVVPTRDDCSARRCRSPSSDQRAAGRGLPLAVTSRMASTPTLSRGSTSPQS